MGPEGGTPTADGPPGAARWGRAGEGCLLSASVLNTSPAALPLPRLGYDARGAKLLHSGS